MPSKLMKTLSVSLTTVCMLIAYGVLPTWAGGDQSLPVRKSEAQTSYQIRQHVAQGTTRSSQLQSVQQPSPQAEMQSQDSASKPFYGTVTEPGKFELGVIGGDPLGISAKLWLSPTRAIDAGLGWSLIGDHTNLQLHGDYLFHNFDVLQVKKGSLPVYSGLGARIRFGEDTRFGVRVPMGVQYISAAKTLSLFLEVAPIVSFIPTAEIDLNLGLGIRFFFFE